MTTFINLLKQLQYLHPHVLYSEADHFHWSPRKRTVFYANDEAKEDEQNACWTLLHETAHALLQHTNFVSDFHLISLEAEAWEKTCEIAKKLQHSIPEENYIQDCIDSYRNWQYRRSICPSCDSGGIQTASNTYSCIKCHNTWEVSRQRFCRAYRKNKLASILN